MWRLFVLLTACNQVYELDGTRLPLPDAPYACKELGTTMPPVFSRGVQQVSTQSLYSYHFTPTGLVVADGGGAIFVGGFDQPLEEAKDIAASPFAVLVDPHPSPDGQRIYVREYSDETLIVTGLSVFERTSSGWRKIEDAPTTIYTKGRPSTVFRGLTGDRMIFVGATNIEEYERDSTGWNARGAHPRAELGVNDRATMSLTADGLRAIFRGATTMMYTDRPNLDSWFRAPLPLDGVPKVDDAQLTEDCARIYYSGRENTPGSVLDTVFFSQQL